MPVLQSIVYRMSVPRFSAILATRKCKTTNTQTDSFENITADVHTFLGEAAKEQKDKELPRLSIRKMSVFVEEGLAWGSWQEATKYDNSELYNHNVLFVNLDLI